MHFDVFAGRNEHARGRSGSLVLRHDEFEAFMARLRPETVTRPSTEPCPIHTWRCAACVCVLLKGHAGVCDVHCQGPSRETPGSENTDG